MCCQCGIESNEQQALMLPTTRNKQYADYPRDVFAVGGCSRQVVLYLLLEAAEVCV
jgi:hypothetical protein